MSRSLKRILSWAMPFAFGAVLVLSLDHLPSTNAEDAKPAKAKNNSDTLKMLDLFGDVFERVREDYVEEVTDTQLVEAAINGMLTNLDPHSSYMNAKAFSDMKVQTRGEFGGLGIEVTMENGLVKVVSPIDDTPASKAGIKPGDFISQIDDTQVMGLTLQEAVEKMRGKPNTDIKLTVIREGAKEPLTFKLTRDVIKIQSARSRIEGDVIYLRVTSFAETTGDMMIAEYEKQKKALGNKKPVGVVLDLRNNPGGLLDQAIAVTDAFLERGEIVSTRGRIEDSSRRYNATAGDITGGLPMVVLINGGSASASEIVSGALKDHHRAVVMGTKSFGKGSVQTVIPLPGDAAMRLTTSRYYTPSGHSIQAKGIEPDIIVEPAKVEKLKDREMATEAGLKGHLVNEDEKTVTVTVTTPETKKEEEKKDDKNASQVEKDYQLARAVDLIRAINIFNGDIKAAATAAPAAKQ